ncbi:WD40 repeat-like protein [Auricularia subglabra TFB-10046 SS5]|nr:WD40 repeat-like protein [Auricularia subglabra TFB-10046 SS5]
MAADEINRLLYAYLMDSGFEHAAFVLRAEARIDSSPFAKTFVKHGLLVELLAKALLYIEVETHWKDDDAAPVTCRAPFSLLKKHVCSSSVPPKQRPSNGGTPAESTPQPQPTPLSNGTNGVQDGTKRKASQLASEDRGGKRARVDDPAAAPAKPAAAPAHRPSRTPSTNVQEIVPVQAGRTSEVVPIQPPQPPAGPVKEPYRLFTPPHDGDVYCSSWNMADPRTYATGSKDGTVRIWDVPSSSSEPIKCAAVLKAENVTIRNPNGKQDIISLDWNRYGTLIATGDYDGHLRVWKKDGTLGYTYSEHLGPIFTVKFSPSGMFLLSASLDGSTVMLDVRAKKLLREYRCHEGSCLDIDWFDDETFVSCGSDLRINVFARVSDVPFRQYVGHEQDLNQVRFNASRKMLASCSDDRTARIWNTRDLKGAAAAWSSASSSLQTVRLGPNDSICVLRGHEDTVTAISWIPHREGKEQTTIATASFDHTARLWDVISGTCLRVIQGQDKCLIATFSPDGAYLSTGGNDSKIQVTAVNSGKLVFEWNFGRTLGASEPLTLYDLPWRRTPDGQFRLSACVGKHIALFDISKLLQASASAS